MKDVYATDDSDPQFSLESFKEEIKDDEGASLLATLIPKVSEIREAFKTFNSFRLIFRLTEFKGTIKKLKSYLKISMKEKPLQSKLRKSSNPSKEQIFAEKDQMSSLDLVNRLEDLHSKWLAKFELLFSELKGDLKVMLSPTLGHFSPSLESKFNSSPLLTK